MESEPNIMEIEWEKPSDQLIIDDDGFDFDLYTEEILEESGIQDNLNYFLELNNAQIDELIVLSDSEEENSGEEPRKKLKLE